MSGDTLLDLPDILQTVKIQRPGSGGDLPQVGEYSPYPVARRVNSTHTIMMDDDIENGSLGPFQDRPRMFPNMRSKAYTPWVRILYSIVYCYFCLIYIFSCGKLSLLSVVNVTCAFRSKQATFGSFVLFLLFFLYLLFFILRLFGSVDKNILQYLSIII